MILGLKIDRRFVAAVGLDDEQFVFADSRFVPWRHPALAAGIGPYLRRILEQVKPNAIYYFAPEDAGAFTTALVGMLEEAAAASGMPAKPVSRTDVFGSFGILPLPTRQALRQHLAHLWPALAECKPHRQTVLAEAAAVALVGDLHQAWPPL